MLQSYNINLSILTVDGQHILTVSLKIVLETDSDTVNRNFYL